MSMVRLTIRVSKKHLRKLDRLHKKFWPPLSVRRGSGAVIRRLINRA